MTARVARLAFQIMMIGVLIAAIVIGVLVVTVVLAVAAILRLLSA